MESARAMWKRVLGYGVLLALGTTLLQWLDYLRLARTQPLELLIFLVACGFLGLGVFVGARLFAGRAPEAPFDGNPKAQAELGISPRELEVLRALVAGHSNKEIAASLHVSPATVKTHVARLYEKLGARRRTDAANKARELGIVP